MPEGDRDNSFLQPGELFINHDISFSVCREKAIVAISSVFLRMTKGWKLNYF